MQVFRPLRPLHSLGLREAKHPAPYEPSHRGDGRKGGRVPKAVFHGKFRYSIQNDTSSLAKKRSKRDIATTSIDSNPNGNPSTIENRHDFNTLMVPAHSPDMDHLPRDVHQRRDPPECKQRSETSVDRRAATKRSLWRPALDDFGDR